MIIEAATKYPRPLTEQARTQTADEVRDSQVYLQCSTKWDQRWFDSIGRFCLSRCSVPEAWMWSSNVMRYDPAKYSLRCHGEFIRVYEGNGLSTSLVQTIDPGNLRYLSKWFSGETIVGENGITKAPLTAIPDWDRAVRLSLEKILQEIERGKESEFYGQPFPMFRVVEPQLMGENVHWLQFNQHSIKPILKEGVLVDSKGRLIEKSIIYPFLSEDQYKDRASAISPVPYQVVNPHDYFACLSAPSSVGSSAT